MFLLQTKDNIIRKQRLWIKFISHPAYIWTLASAYLNQEEEKKHANQTSVDPTLTHNYTGSTLGMSSTTL